MAGPYSSDLRERVVEAIEREGLSRRQAAARFGVGIKTAIDWVRRFRETGSVAALPMVGSGRRRLPVSIVIGWCGDAGPATSPCAAWSPSWAIECPCSKFRLPTKDTVDDVR